MTTDFNKFGLYYKDTQMSDLVKIQNEPIIFISNYFGVYRQVILKILIINLVQPFEFLNSEKLHPNMETPVNLLFFLNYKSLGDYQKYYGTFNDYLLFFYLIIRVFYIVKYMVSFFYMN